MLSHETIYADHPVALAGEGYPHPEREAVNYALGTLSLPHIRLSSIEAGTMLQVSGVLAGDAAVSGSQLIEPERVYGSFPELLAKHRRETAEQAGKSAQEIQEGLKEAERRAEEDAQHPQRTEHDQDDK